MCIWYSYGLINDDKYRVFRKCTPPQSPTLISRQPLCHPPPPPTMRVPLPPDNSPNDPSQPEAEPRQSPPPKEPDPQRSKNSMKPRPPKFQPLCYAPKTFSRSTHIPPGQTSINRKMENTSTKTFLFKLSGLQIHRQGISCDKT